MKNRLARLLLVIVVLALTLTCGAQCAMCTKTAAQLGEKPAEGLNAGIVYLMMTPFAIMAFIGYRWWKGRER